jgi:hypothetical protein
MAINRQVASTIYSEVRAAVAAGKPMSTEQIVARLKELGVKLEGVNLAAL